MPTSRYSSTSSGQISPEDQTTSTWIHLFPLLAAFFNFVVAFPYLGLLAAVFLYYNHRERGEFVKQNARESLNFQITLAIIWTFYLIISFAAFASFFFTLLWGPESALSNGGSRSPSFFDLGAILPMIIFGIGMWVFTVIVLILATLKSSRGEIYNY